MAATWWRREADGTLVLNLHIQPGARQSGAMGVHGDALKVRVAAPPVDGKANEALIAWLAERLDVSKRAVGIRHGHTGRRKTVAVQGTSADPEQRLAAP